MSVLESVLHLPDFQASETPSEQLESFVQLTLPSLLSYGHPEPFPESLHSKYVLDSFFKLVLDSPSSFKNFVVDGGLVFRWEGESRILCIPDVWIDGK